MPAAYTGADLLVSCLAASGVSVVFGVPGDTGVALYDALYRSDGAVRHVLARDERHAAFMADGYARASNAVGAVEVSSGGGTTFVIGGLGESFAASVPVLVITSDIQVASRGTGALTEIDQKALFSAVTKWQRIVESAEEIPAAVADALAVATSGRPAPVVLIVPEDVLDQAAERRTIRPEPTAVRIPRERPPADPAAVARAASDLAGAARPVIIAGSGVHLSTAWADLAAAAERLAIPVATTVHGKGSIATTSPWSLGVIGGNGGCEATNDYLRNADVVLLIGTRANATDTDGWTAPPREGPRVIGLDIAPERAGRNFPGSLPLVGDVSTVLQALVAASPEVTRERRDARLALVAGVVDEHRRTGQMLTDRREATSSPAPLNGDVHVEEHRARAADVIDALSELVREVPHIVVADPGTPTPHVASRWPVRRPGRNILAPRGHGPMGYAIPAAIGASIACPEAIVLALVADGSFAMSCGELETVHRLGLPIVYVQLTNYSLGWIKMLQHLYTGGRYFGVDPGPIDAVMVAQASGLAAKRVHNVTQLREAVATAIKDRHSIYVDVPVRHVIDDVPPVSSWHAALAGDTARPAY